MGPNRRPHHEPTSSASFAAAAAASWATSERGTRVLGEEVAAAQPRPMPHGDGCGSAFSLPAQTGTCALRGTCSQLWLAVAAGGNARPPSATFGSGEHVLGTTGKPCFSSLARSALHFSENEMKNGLRSERTRHRIAPNYRAKIFLAFKVHLTFFFLHWEKVSV